MLSELDDTLLHQHPTPFGHVHTSDKRWFDRMMFGIFDPEQGVSVAAGLGYYINTNVADGFGALILDAEQANVRVSRALRPDLTSMSVRGLSVSVRQGLRHIRLAMDPGSNALQLGFEIDWLASSTPWLEPPHFSRHEARVISDHVRFNQVGRARGWVALGNKRVTLGAATHAVRDHSWGVRPGMGGYENEPTYHDTLGAAIWMLLSLGERHGYVSAAFDHEGVPRAIHGVLGDKPVARLEHQLTFIPNSRRVAGGTLRFTLLDGEIVEARVEPVGTPMNEQAWGYQHGWFDRRGMGVPRAHAQEEDLWTLSDPSTCRSLTQPDFPAQARNWDQPVRLHAQCGGGAAWLVSVIPSRFAPYGFVA